MFMVAVGNVVVEGVVWPEFLNDSGYAAPGQKPETAAALLANLGVQRVERLGGPPQRGPML